MLKIFNMEDCKPVCTPMITDCKLSKEDEAKEVDQKICRLMVGSLLYVTASRLDIIQVVGMVSRFQVSPKETHVQAIKRIFRYVKGTLNFGLWYPRSEDLTLVAFTYMD